MRFPTVYIASQQIDLQQGELNKLLSNHAIVNAENIAARASSASTVIKAPGTRHNRRVFGNLHLGTSSQKITLNTPARIEVEGTVILKGNFRFIKAEQQGDQITYHFIIIGQNSWAKLLSERALSDLDLSDYDHYLSAEVILWSQANADKSVFLYTHPQPPATGSVEPRHFHLALNVRRLLHLIFNAAGYRLVSDFVDSDFFERLWFYPSFQEKNNTEWELLEVKAGNSAAINHTTGGGDPDYNEITIPFDYDNNEYTNPGTGELENTGLKDPSNNYNTTTYSYTVSRAGGYAVRVELPFDNSDVLADQNFTQLHIDGNLQEQIILTRTQLQDNDKRLEVHFREIYLRVGQTISFRFFYDHPNAASFPRTYTVEPFKGKISIQAITDLANYELVKLNEYYPMSAQQVALVKDLALLFQLEFATNEAIKTVYCEPDANFYGSKQRDISHIVDLNKKITVSKYADAQKERFTFQYAGQTEPAQIFNSVGKKGAQAVQLEFFARSSYTEALAQYAGIQVLEIPGANQLFYYHGSQSVQKHQLYRINNDDVVQPGPTVIPQVSALPDTAFSDDRVNLNFEDDQVPGLLSVYYASLPNRLSLQKVVVAYCAWSIIDIAAIEAEGGNKESGFRQKYYHPEHGQLRLTKIENYDAARQGSVKSAFVQDISSPAIPVSAGTHQAAPALAVQSNISKVYVNRVDEFANPLSIGYTLTIEHLGVISEYAKVQFPYFEDIDWSTALTDPNGFVNLVKPTGNPPTAESAIRNNANVNARISTPSLAPIGVVPLHFYADNYLHPVWIAGYGYEDAIEEGDNIVIEATARSLSAGNFTANVKFELEIIGEGLPQQSTPQLMNVNQEVTVNFLSSTLFAGFYTYRLKLLSDYQGSYQEVDSITAKLIVRG